MGKHLDPIVAALANCCCCGCLGYHAIDQKKKAFFSLIYSSIIFLVLSILFFIFPETLIFLFWIVVWILVILLTCLCSIGVFFLPTMCWCTLCCSIVCFTITVSACIGVGIVSLTVIVGFIPLICGICLIICCCPPLLIWFLLMGPISILQSCGCIAIILIPSFTLLAWVSFPAGIVFMTPFCLLPIIWMLSGLPFAIDVYLLLKKKKASEIAPGDCGVSLFRLLPGFHGKTSSNQEFTPIHFAPQFNPNQFAPQFAPQPQQFATAGYA